MTAAPRCLPTTSTSASTTTPMRRGRNSWRPARSICPATRRPFPLRSGVLAADLNRPVNDLGFDVLLQIVFADKAAHDEYQKFGAAPEVHRGGQGQVDKAGVRFRIWEGDALAWDEPTMGDGQPAMSFASPSADV